MPSAIRVVSQLKDQDDVVALLTAGNDGKALVWDNDTSAFEMGAVGGGSSPFFDVTDYGATGDGSTDDSGACQDAIDAAAVDGGTIYFPPNTYRLSTGLTYTALKHVEFLGYGALLKPDAGVTALLIHQDDGGNDAQACSVRGLHIDGTARADAAVGIEVRDTCYCALRDLRIINCGTGILLSTESLWTEATNIQNSLVLWCTTGLKFEKKAGAGTGSFMQTHTDSLAIIAVTCVSIGTGAMLWRSNLWGIDCWLQTTYVNGWNIDGDMQGSVIESSLEMLTGAGTGITIGSNATNCDRITWHHHWFYVAGTKVTVAASKVLRLIEGGRVYTYLGSGATEIGTIETYQGTDTEARVKVTGNFAGGGGFTLGPGGASAGDANLYRKSANQLATDDSLEIGATLTVDTVNEKTSAAGVTIEGVLIKDGLVDGVDVSGISGGGGDAADITYTPTTAADWDSATDPGNVDDALNQLANRAKDLETIVTGGGGAVIAADTLWDAAGDLVQGTGANTAARLAIGTANQLLRVNSGATAVEWASVGRVLLATATPTTGTTVTFDSIPGTYNNLVVEYVGRSGASANYDDLAIRCNNDTTAGNYRYIKVGAYLATSADNAGADDALIGTLTGANSPANSPGAGSIRILNYAGTTFKKQIHALGGYRNNDSTAHMAVGARVAEWESTNAITRLDFIITGNYVSGTTFRLYGEY